ncbi:MAG: hypothetical protein WDW38_009144 [Sanguina aurantia]
MDAKFWSVRLWGFRASTTCWTRAPASTVICKGGGWRASQTQEEPGGLARTSEARNRHIRLHGGIYSLSAAA